VFSRAAKHLEECAPLTPLLSGYKMKAAIYSKMSVVIEVHGFASQKNIILDPSRLIHQKYITLIYKRPERWAATRLPSETPTSRLNLSRHCQTWHHASF
jgi:hypothetical protein